MYQRKKTLNEEIGRIRNLLGFEYSNVILEQEEEFTTFEFTESYPDNVAFPIIKNADIETVNDVLKFLNPKLTRFIDSLNNKLNENPSIGKIIINSGASSKDANRNVPDGFNQSIVNYSFKSDGVINGNDLINNPVKMSVSNDTLKINRANFMKWILQSKIPQLTDDMFEINTNLTEKTVNVLIPTSLNLKDNNSIDQIIKSEWSESTQPYTDPTKSSGTIGCNSKGESRGNVGLKENGYIADRIVLNTGNKEKITFNYQAFIVPDQFIVKKKTTGSPFSDKDEVVYETGYVSSALTDIKTILNTELNQVLGQPVTIKSPGYGSMVIDTEIDKDYYVNIIAPLGATKWKASLICGDIEAKPSFAPCSKFMYTQGLSGNQKLYIGVDGKYYTGECFDNNPNLQKYLTRYMEGNFKRGALTDGFGCNNGKWTEMKDGRWKPTTGNEEKC